MNLSLAISKVKIRSFMIVSEMKGKYASYSLSYSLYSTIWWIAWYLKLKKITMWAFVKKKEYIYSYIESNFGDIVSKYQEEQLYINSISNYPIWVFWAQGFDNAPELVKTCHKNLLKKQKNVISLDLSNISNYVHIPDYVYDRVNNKSMSLTHLSDLLRVTLLSEYGGLWVDSTCWTSSAIPKYVKDLSFYSAKQYNAPVPLSSNSRWCAWVLGTNRKNHKLFSFTRDILKEYAKKEVYYIDYLFVDYVMSFAADKFDDVSNSIEQCPENSKNRNNLHFLLNSSFNEDTYNELTKDEWIFKLSLKTPWNKISNEKKLSFYGNLINISDEE